MSALLLDTGILVEILAVPEASFVPSRIFDVIDTADRVALSVASIYEINQKTKIGKLTTNLIDQIIMDEIQGEGIEILPLSALVMAQAASLPWLYKGREHRDPFDRMLAATAISETLTIVSVDPAFDALNIDRIWT